MTSSIIKAVFRIQTDDDFTLKLPQEIKGLHKIKYNQNYKITLYLKEDTAIVDILKFLNQIEIVSATKDWLNQDLKVGIEDYTHQLETNGLSSCYGDLLGGGNWSFAIHISRITEQLL